MSNEEVRRRVIRLCGSRSRWNFHTMFRCRRKVEKLGGHQIWGSRGAPTPQNFFSRFTVEPQYVRYWPPDRPPFSETKSSVVARIADRTGCQWFWPYLRYGRLELETFRWKLRPNHCRWRYGYYWQPIGSRQRPIRWHHRRPATTYRLATIHPWRMDDIRTKDDKHANSLTVAQVRSAKNAHCHTRWWSVRKLHHRQLYVFQSGVQSF